jgi:hypothetical protein
MVKRVVRKRGREMRELLWDLRQISERQEEIRREIEAERLAKCLRGETSRDRAYALVSAFLKEIKRDALRLAGLFETTWLARPGRTKQEYAKGHEGE